jgi:hypothetical protein
MRSVATSATTAAVFVRALDVSRRDVAHITFGDLRQCHGSGDDNYKYNNKYFLHFGYNLLRACKMMPTLRKRIGRTSLKHCTYKHL